MKHCGGCGRDLPESGFHRSKHHGLQTQCKKCQADYRRRRLQDPQKLEAHRAYHAAYRERNKEQRRAYAQRYYAQQDKVAKRFAGQLRGYGITVEDYATMLNEQDLRCAICHDELDCGRQTHIDHCHTTGVVRGLLCFCCNGALGLAKDSPARLQSMIDYLSRGGDAHERKV